MVMWMSLVACGIEPSGRSDNAFGGIADGDDAGELDEIEGEERYTLTLDESPAPELTLQMNRDEVEELFGDRAADITLLEIDPGPLLTHALLEVRDSCGTQWQDDDPNPDHDCTQTPLGQTFQGADGRWETSSEYSMVRLLTMTPANVVVTGTTSQGLQELADGLWIIDDYSTILADALGTPRNQTVVSIPALVTAFRHDFLATHPSVDATGTLEVTLEDALSDMTSLGARLGPAGAHPGVVAPGSITYGEVLGPDFEMFAKARSNMRVLDAIDASVGKTYATAVADLTGPTFGDALEFDFDDPERFSVGGLVEDLTIDLVIRLQENDHFVSSCVGLDACKLNLPGAPLGPSSVWALDPWATEALITSAAYQDYRDRVYSVSYLLGTAGVDIGHNGNPPGWLQYNVLFNLGNPPRDQFLWETVLEVAQVALHDTPFAEFPEGTADVSLQLRDIPVGLTGAEAKEAVRPYLREQSAEISDFLIGDPRPDNVGIDFYYRLGEDGRPYVFFTAPGDLPQTEPYRFATPGFFAGPSLAPSDKLSGTHIVGLSDTLHEKLPITAGETVTYFADETGQRYRARFFAESDWTEIEVAIAPVDE